MLLVFIMNHTRSVCNTHRRRDVLDNFLKGHLFGDRLAALLCCLEVRRAERVVELRPREPAAAVEVVCPAAEEERHDVGIRLARRCVYDFLRTAPTRRQGNPSGQPGRSALTSYLRKTNGLSDVLSIPPLDGRVGCMITRAWRSHRDVETHNIFHLPWKSGHEDTNQTSRVRLHCMSTATP